MDLFSGATTAAMSRTSVTSSGRSVVTVTNGTQRSPGTSVNLRGKSGFRGWNLPRLQSQS